MGSAPDLSATAELCKDLLPKLLAEHKAAEGEAKAALALRIKSARILLRFTGRAGR